MSIAMYEAAVSMFLLSLLAQRAYGFYPLLYPRTALPRGKKCNNIFYPSFEFGTLNIFDGEMHGKPYGAPRGEDKGKISLSGGIEMAIDPKFCARMSHIDESDERFEEQCDQIKDTVMRAAAV